MYAKTDNALQYILDLYNTREYKICDLSHKIGISEYYVRKILHDHNYYHGIHRNNDNMINGRKIKPLIFLDNYKFLERHFDEWF